MDEIVAADAVGHVGSASIRGTAGLRERIAALYAIYSDPRFTIEDQVAEGDRVLTRWTFSGTHTGETMGRPATGRQVRVTGMNLFRIAGGKIREIWVNSDDLGELQQLGLIPAAEPGD